MSEPFLGEIRMVGFSYAPRGWAFCDGQLLGIAQHESLYSLLGTTYGGDGRTTFAVPDLRGRTPIHKGSSPGGSRYHLGQKGGDETHTLTVDEMGPHRHTFRVSSNTFIARKAIGRVLATTDGALAYRAQDDTATLNADSVAKTGGGRPHNNIQPCTALNFCIALMGIYPSRN
ncbi:MAG: tail fiber protein [Chloroflexota bacterium]